ncbi:V-type ATP synthase subunit E [Clostridium lacusfryxellense]|uniref:V-type ATP synthase subunit E n=1 Tax=Clostridium lacusfryxellense TaxID=205328 RepID=UPI001C0CEE31|nr:V-type ATP synthase subunit E family protein [Clostridium lacusfryxellense]MBU3110445.1 V-type proton ATPase subunit E [Clostridium lacusfryxellense]
MTTIEDKISLFSKIIYDKVNEEKKERLDLFNIEAQRKISTEKEKIKDLSLKLQSESQKKSSIKSNALIAKEKLNKQREVLLLKDKLIEDALESVHQRLLDFVCLDEYKSYFISGIQRNLKAIDKGSYYILVLKRDYDKFKSEIEDVLKEYTDYNIQIKISEDDFIGGHLLKDFDGRFRMDSSIYSTLHESKELIGVRVMEMLA